MTRAMKPSGLGWAGDIPVTGKLEVGAAMPTARVGGPAEAA